MRYRCTKCGNKCTVSMLKSTRPERCLIDDRDAHWELASEAVDNPHSSKIKQARIRDGRGQVIERVNPMDRSDVQRYMSISDAGEDTGISKGSISRAVKSHGKLAAGGFYWRPGVPDENQLKIKVAALTGVEEYREALKQYAPERYIEIFGEE